MASKFKDANGFIPYEFLDTFGREFFKREVLWKPKTNCNEFQIQPRTHIAYRTLAQTLNLSVEDVLEILKTFPTACLDLMRRYETCSRLDEECRVPDWLRTLAPHFRLLNNSIINRGGTTEHDTSAKSGRRDLVRALYDSARMGLRAGQAGGLAGAGGSAKAGRQAGVTENGTEDEASPLQSPQAIACFVQKHRLTENQVAPAWRSALRLCQVQLGALLAAGDRSEAVPAALAAGAAERALADLALLHEPRMSQLALLTPAKLRTLVLLFQLIVAAKEIYDREERLHRHGAGDTDTEPGGGGGGGGGNGGGGGQEGRHARGGEEEDVTTAIIRLYDVPAEIADSDRISDTSSGPNRFNSTIEELSIKYIEPCNTQNLSRERVVQWQSRRDTNDVGDTTLEESSGNELHTELDLEPDTHIISSDTSDYETSTKYLEEYSVNNIQDPILLEEYRVEESGSNLIEKNDIRNEKRQSDISSKSQNFDSKSQYPTKYWYEESKSNSSEEQRVVWALVYADFIKRGRSASLISLQHRWVELLHRARVALLTAWTSDTHADRNVHPLLLVVAYWFPEIVTESLPPWEKLVLERQIILESDIKDIIDKYQENDNVLLNITENLPYPDFLKEYVNNKDINYPCHSKSNSTNKHLSYQMYRENPSRIIDNNIDKVIEQESQPQESATNNELKVNNCISTMLDQIDPSKATVSIIFDEDSDEDAKDDNSVDVRENKHDLNNLQVLKREGGATYSREQQHQTPSALDKCSRLTEITMNIEKELQDKLKYMNNFRSDNNTENRNNNTELNKNNNGNNELHSEDQIVRDDFGSQDELNLLGPKSPEIVFELCSRNAVNCKNYRNRKKAASLKIKKAASLKIKKAALTSAERSRIYRLRKKQLAQGIKSPVNEVLYTPSTSNSLMMSESSPQSDTTNEKLVHLSRVVVTPIDHLPEWKKHSRNGVIRCRSFSVKNFTKLVIPKSNQLSKCTPYVNTNKDTFHTKDYDKIKSEIDSEEHESENLRKNEVRIKFEDDDINNGIVYQKYIELYSMPDHWRKNRITLTRKLKLSRTYFSLNFWCLERNIELMKLCKPVTIKVNKGVPRVAKRVELPDINEVRRINRSILTAQVSPTLDTTPLHALRASASQEAEISTNYCITSNSGTTRETNNSISSALDSSELLKLLTDYAIKAKIPKKNFIESVTKDINSYSNLMDSILETMRRADENNIQNSIFTGTSNYLQQTDPSEVLAESCSTNITTTDTYNTIQKCIEKVQDNSQLNSINNSLTTSNIHISSNSTKELYIKHVQKMHSINNQEEARTPTVRELRDMILHLVKHLDTTMRHYNTMKIDRSSLNLHMKKFDRQRRALVKNISKLTKILPKYYLIEEHRSDVNNARATIKRKKINWSKCKESKERATLPSGVRDDIIDLASNTNSVCADDDCEPNLVIDESSLQLTDNIELNNSQFNKINMYKNIQETCDIKKRDKKKKILTKTKKKSNPSNKISEEDKPMLNEYQEWQRQKTMALKYFTIPMSDTSKLTLKDKIAQQQTTTRPTEQQSNGCQTNISIKRKINEGTATTSAEQQSNGCQTNISIKRKINEDIATTSAEQQSNGCQTNISIKSKNNEDIATTSAEQQSNGCQTNISIKRKINEDIATTSAEQQSNGCQTNISIKRKINEGTATTSAEQQSNGCQTNISIKRKINEGTATTSAEQQSNGCQTNISIKRKINEGTATTSAEQQSNGCQTNISMKSKNNEDIATTSAEQQSSDCQTNITIKIINTEEFVTTSAEQRSYGCQTNIPIKRKKKKDFLTTPAKQQSNYCQTIISRIRKNTNDFPKTTTTSATSDIIRRSKLHPSESNVVCISDTSSDDDVQITECSLAKDTVAGNINENNHRIDKTENGNKILIYNETSQNQTTNQNVCVISTPVAAITSPVYFIINDTQTPTATPDAITKTQDAETINNPLVFQVHSNATPFPTLTQIVPQNQIEQTQAVVNNENNKQLVQGSYRLQCQRAFNTNCRCIRCNTDQTADVLTSTLNAIQTLTSQDLSNNMPSTSLLKQNHRPIKEAITVMEYLSSNKKLTALIKVGGSQNLLFFCNKYIILTDVNIPSINATYRTTIRTKRYKSLSEVLVPSDRRGNVLLLGLKKESDYIYCKCVKGAGVSCNLCDRIITNLPNPTNFLKIGSDYYKKMSEKPIKYVRLSENELVTNSRLVLEGNPDLILVSHMFFKKLTDTPPTYVRILSSVKDTATLRHLIRKQVQLYAFDVTQTQHYHTPLAYAHTAGHVTVDHTDDDLVKVLQWLLN